jgi:hypothetical protein
MELDQATQAGARRTRRSLRHAVAVDCVLRSDAWDAAEQARASNLSVGGMWVETARTLPPGALVFVSFTPPGARKPVWAAAEVMRVAELANAEHPPEPCGMALAFTYCSERDLRLLARSLLGRPPSLPMRSRPPPLPPRQATEDDADDSSATIDA